jgi:multisubunit Na+/H+ antiporter MnhB subunit
MDTVYLYNAVAGTVIAFATIIITMVLKLKELSNEKPSEWLMKILVVLVTALVVVVSIILLYAVTHYLLNTGGCGYDC